MVSYSNPSCWFLLRYTLGVQFAFLGFLFIRSRLAAVWLLVFFIHIIMVFKYTQKPRLARAFYSARRGLRSLLLCCYSFGKDYLYYHSTILQYQYPNHRLSGQFLFSTNNLFILPAKLFCMIPWRLELEEVNVIVQILFHQSFASE